MDIRKRLSSQLEGHSIYKIVYRFITEPTAFESSVYDESYDILKSYCNNLSGDEKFDVKYEIFQIEAPYIGDDKVERTSNMMRGIQTVYKEISFQDL
ncbi:hypothetical protein E2R60_22870 [Paenibacillus dendritiformis]|uniref:hypothetical protein n=1 Tax=Paenibacillus dendritiformis TaxID=130049 RepID=UPI001059EEEB|nr:hypothetical protein [Paenibacillus dendritiformis]TDL50377.1 hypothetical protein E2R60_22870 [Paenibacillus dendritiformis]